MQNIDRNARRQQDEKRLQHPMVEEKNDGMKNGNPNEWYGNNLDPQRNGLVLTEITDIRSELRMIQQMII